LEHPQYLVQYLLQVVVAVADGILVCTRHNLAVLAAVQDMVIQIHMQPLPQLHLN
jgi:hypothetical protein